MKPSTTRIVAAIGLLSAGSLLLELTFVRVFSFLFFAHYAFMIISTALFGLGLAGVVLNLRGLPANEDAARAMRRAAAAFAGVALLAMAFAHLSPVKVSHALSGQGLQIFYLILYYAVIGAPFYFVGRAVSIGLSAWSEQADRLYFGDLLGAGGGCLLLFICITPLKPMGTACVVAAMALASALLLSDGCTRACRAALIFAVLAAAALSPFAGGIVPMIPRDHKRVFKKDWLAGRIRWSRWGALSRVDVAEWGPDLAVLWIDGGTNQSSLIRFDGDFDRGFDKARWGRRRDSLIYRLREPGRVAVIGAAGSHEVVAAAGFGAREVVGIEMDPLVVEAVVKKYAGFIGRPYEKPHIRMVCAEGRSYLERTREAFDVIQQVNNFTPVALASGALNVSETYLVTVEAFRLYLRRLTPDGIVNLRRHGDIRVASVAMEALRLDGVEEPWRHIVILNDDTYVKKSPWTTPEIDRIVDLAGQMRLAPRFLPDRVVREGSWYERFLRSRNPRKWYRRDVAILAPSTDDWPFINHYVSWGRTRDPGLPRTISWYNDMKYFKVVPHGDFILLCILAEAAVLSLVFLILPMARAQGRELTPAALLPVAYFATLGFGFIFVEICLMQRLTLLLGHPSLSLAVVLSSLLAAAGLGSLCSRRLGVSEPRGLRAVLAVNIALIVAAVRLLPLVVARGLLISTPGRVSIAVAAAGLHGFFLGMPFPAGVRILGRRRRRLVPWGWAMNSYATVVGSVLSVMIAMSLGFRAVYLLAAGAYGIALLAAGSLARE